MIRTHRELGRLTLAGLAIVTAIGSATVTGCSTSTHRHISPSGSAASAVSVGSARATLGPLTISGGYIPQPASPDVAAAYLTITNTGAAPDVITKITTNVTSSVTAMTETTGNGVGSMTELRSVTVPAHGQVTFTPGHAHLMLANPTQPLRPGQQVRVTITFRHLGPVVVALPVVPLR